MNQRALARFVASALGLFFFTEVSLCEHFAAQVIRRKRDPSDLHPVDPNAQAIQPTPQRSLPALPKSSGVIEEDLVNPSATTKRQVRPMDPRPSEPTPEGVLNPPPAPDPRTNRPPPPPSSEEMRPSRQPDIQSGRRPHAGDLEEDGDTGVSLGIGFGSQSFSASLGFMFPIYNWLGWGLSGSFHTWTRDEYKETRYGPEATITLRIPSRVPLTPFGGVGVGYDLWKRKNNEQLFDDRASFLNVYFLGVSIPMSEHLALNISQTWRTYLGLPPKRFEDETKYERYGTTRFDVGLAVVF